MVVYGYISFTLSGESFFVSSIIIPFSWFLPLTLPRMRIRSKVYYYYWMYGRTFRPQSSSLHRKHTVIVLNILARIWLFRKEQFAKKRNKPLLRLNRFDVEKLEFFFPTRSFTHILSDLNPFRNSTIANSWTIWHYFGPKPMSLKAVL